MIEDSLAPEKLLLDPNNFRFHDLDGFLLKSETRFHESTVQQAAYDRIREDEALHQLKNSIIRNTYIPIERIVVRPYEHAKDNFFVVIEGNRRIAAIKWILQDHDAGVSIDQDVLDSIAPVPVIIVEEEVPDEVFRASLMGIRHVSGIKQWGGYQRAKLVATMRDDLDLDTSEVADRLAMTAHEVNRRYRAFKALQQMQNDEEYGGFATPSMYPLFHEAVALPTVREWLHWDEQKSIFVDPAPFYQLLSPTENEEEEEEPVEPKIKTYSEVRQLRSILANEDAKRVLQDPSRSLIDALTIAHQHEMSHSWRTIVQDAVAALQSMNIHELKSMTPEHQELLKKLSDLAEERLSDYNALQKN